MTNRATRHELKIPLRFRRSGQQDWSAGETINVSESGILFASNDLLEIDSRLEITFQTNSAPELRSSTRAAMVVRRVLSNWPETKVLFGIRFCS
jgi:hypothetical protein